MKILVTGGLGKVGQWLVRELIDGQGGKPVHEVTVLDRVMGPERAPAKYLMGDIDNLGEVMEAMAGADAVIHLAAIHNPNIATTSVVYQTNVIGTFNVHHAAYRLGVKRVVSASSNAIVGWSYSERFEPDYLPIDEDHPLRPEDVYGLSKEIGETIARAYARKGVETVMLRPSGVVTPDELAELKQIGGRPPTSFQAFSYIDARDLAAAFRLAVERDIPNATVMFVVADDSNVAEPLCDLLPRLRPSIGDKARALTGTKAVFSNQRAKEILGWQPKYSWRSA
ncbi:MAG: NAD(P)-dependent oxidoreductase [Deltaproteobacteria bacterium]|nr:NAD(P)-dependent oxidoreductase [Deltaproteobacteria bacterium]